MLKLLFVCVLALPVGLQAQGDEVAVSSSSPALHTGPDSSATARASAATQETSGAGFFSRGLFTPSAHDAPAGSLTASYVYQYAPDLVGANRSLMGWSVTPEVNFKKYLGLQAEFTSLYMRGVYPGQSRLIMAAGPRFNFAPHSRFSPFAFAEGGEVRATTKANDIADWNPVVSGGIGVNYKLSRSVAFQLIPGQYVAQLQDDHNWNHSFMSKAGITFNLYK
ncbi:MAG: hypothetical protein QOE55_325 [Acidobacteriaceae bacterium]|jgi:hypothetical protein|nr:hypothetical protein [Acidobacteriaceae bacterium]